MARTAFHRNLAQILGQSGAVTVELNRINRDVRNVRADVGNAQQGLGVLQNDVRAVRNDLGAVNSDVGVVRTDVTTVQQQIEGLQNQVPPDLIQRLDTVEKVTGVVFVDPVKLDTLVKVRGIGAEIARGLRRLGIDTPQKLVARVALSQGAQKLSVQLRSLGLPTDKTEVRDINDWVRQIMP